MLIPFGSDSFTAGNTDNTSLPIDLVSTGLDICPNYRLPRVE
jgi:hypothetical protein